MASNSNSRSPTVPFYSYSAKARLWLNLGLLLITITGIAISAHLHIQRLKEAGDWVAHTQEVLRHIESLLSLLKDAETSQRGYLLTDDENYLRPYQFALSRHRAEFNKLRELTIDNSSQQERLDSIRTTFKEKTDELAQTIALHRSGKHDQALEIVNTDRGKLVMERARQLIQEMKDEETRLLLTRQEESRLVPKHAKRFVLAGTLFALFTAAAVGTLLTKNISNLLGELAVNRNDLAAYARQLEQTNVDLEQFAYIASHDLQEPLRKIQAYTELVYEECSSEISEDGLKYLEVVINGAVRLKDLVTDLLTFSRIKSHTKELALVDAHGALTAAIDNLEVVIRENDAKIKVDQLPVVRADHSQLVMLFQNLISNALKYRSEQQPEIRIGSTETPLGYKVYVKDNGIGIEQEHHDQVFQIFKRLHGRNERGGGTGIGLANCKRIVERFGGQIDVESTPGQGATFTFLINAH